MASSNTPNTPQDETAPSLNVLAQFVKDFSFENPNAPDILAKPPQTQPQININVNVNARQLGDSDYEVDLQLEAKAGEGKTMLFACDITYSGIFRIQNVPADSLQPVIMIECPRLLFPFARQIIADATRNGGYPPLMIDPIDFVSLFRQRAQAQAGQQQQGSQKPQASAAAPAASPKKAGNDDWS
ncbi:MAG: protein-export chaperone SecB [Pseudomonadota bacterium]